MMEKDDILSGGVGATKEASFLRLLNKTLTQNFKVRELYSRAYSGLLPHVAHRYDKVRAEVAKMFATLLSFDLPHHDAVGGGKEWNMGAGFPRLTHFMAEVMPKMSLNMHNPDLNGLVRIKDVRVDDDEEEESEEAGKEEEVAMEVDDDQQEDKEEEAEDDAEEEDDENSEETRILQTVSMFVINFIQTNYNTIRPEFYQLLPFLCQFTGQESKKQEVGQACLKVNQPYDYSTILAFLAFSK